MLLSVGVSLAIHAFARGCRCLTPRASLNVTKIGHCQHRQRTASLEQHARTRLTLALHADIDARVVHARMRALDEVRERTLRLR